MMALTSSSTFIKGTIFYLIVSILTTTGAVGLIEDRTELHGNNLPDISFDLTKGMIDYDQFPVRPKNFKTLTTVAPTPSPTKVAPNSSKLVKSNIPALGSFSLKPTSKLSTQSSQATVLKSLNIPTKSISPTLRPVTTQPSLRSFNKISSGYPFQSTKTTSPSKSELNLKSRPPSSTRNPNSAPTNAPTKNHVLQATSSSPTLSPFNDIQYHANKSILIGNMTAYNIYVGDFSSTSTLRRTKELMDYFATYLGDSSWFSIIKSYYQIDSKTNKKRYASGNLNFGGSVNIFEGNVTISITIKDITKVLLYLFNKGILPVNSQGVYTFILRGDTQIDGWLLDWCGLHFGIPLNDGTIVNISIVIDTGSVQEGTDTYSCVAEAFYTSNSNMGADNMASVFAHEVVEIITNYNGAWYFGNEMVNGHEIADVCNWTFGEVDGNNSNVQVGKKRFLLTQIWQPGVGCTLTKQQLPLN